MLKLSCVDFCVLRIKLAHKLPPRLKPVLATDKTDDLGGLAIPFSEGTQVSVDGLGLGKLEHGQARSIQRIFLLAGPEESLADFLVVHRQPGDEPLAP